ncbi:hypothetical protein ACF0H5_020663 [Mactra antiquata]
MAKSTVVKPESEYYDIFIVHCSEDNAKAEIINNELKKVGKKTFAHYKEGAEFPAGRPVFDNIIHAVNYSKIVLLLLTKKALESNWVSFEVLISLEKSHRENALCVRLVFQGVSDEEKQDFLKGPLHLIPSVDLDFNDKDWLDKLVANIDNEVKMAELLPGGNVAHGLVYNHYIGYLAYVLPATKENVTKSEYFSTGKFSKKYFIVIPESCTIQPLDGQHGDILIEKMDRTIDMDVTHGDKRRKYSPVVYKVTKKGVDETYYFTGDVPFILATMSKMKEQGFADIDIHLQWIRFCKTLQELVEHRSPNNKCRGTAHIIDYNDKKGSFAPLLWDALVDEFKELIPAEEKQKVRQAKGKLSEDKDNTVTATITYFDDSTEDQGAAYDIQEFLKTKSVQFGNGNGGTSKLQDLQKSRWKIFILSEIGVQNNEMSVFFDSAIEASVSDNLVQVIPVLAKGSDLCKLPYRFRWTTLLKQCEPDYLEKLWKVMQDEKTMTDFLPAGVVYEGLAYAFLMNYMCFNLTYETPSGRDFDERFLDGITKYCKEEDCICVPKVFVIVPKTCCVPAPGTQFEREVHLGALEPIVLGPRKYFLQFYMMTLSNGQKVCYAREYATPAIALHDMANGIAFAGLDKHQMNVQAKKFAEFSNEIMQNQEFNTKFRMVHKRCTIVYFDDEDIGREGVITVLEKELLNCIKDKNILKV